MSSNCGSAYPIGCNPLLGPHSSQQQGAGLLAEPALCINLGIGMGPTQSLNVKGLVNG